jgi:hypothetical protein
MACQLLSDAMSVMVWSPMDAILFTAAAAEMCTLQSQLDSAARARTCDVHLTSYSLWVTVHTHGHACRSLIIAARFLHSHTHTLHSQN